YTLAADRGPFAGLPVNESLLLLLVFVSTVMVTGLMLCAVLSQLERAMAGLEQRVRERTAALESSERRFRLMVESVVDYAIFMLDAEGRVSSWNAGAERILGYGADDIVGRSLTTFYLPEDIARRKPAIELEVAAAGG